MIKRDITFIYMDTAEKAAYEPIAKEAKKRGYKVRLTKDKYARCEIGFYCQHNNFPQYSKFSLIMLHDIIQQYGNWPDIWFREPWNKYDVGILPSDQWESNWNKSSQWYYSKPRIGVYKIGWPKADAINELRKNTYREDFYKKYGLNLSKKTVLYAPAWENDGKQDDFVQSMLKLDVNIIIKQCDWDPTLHPDQVQNIKEMYELHKDNERVTILPPATNIFVAIAVSDILVSEESSTMCEAAMMSVPAVSVSNWLIPDVKPSRLPKCDYDFVVSTTKEELTNTVSLMVQDYDNYRKKIGEFAAHNFLNIGNTSSMIMDIVDDCVEGSPVRYNALHPQPKKRLSLGRFIAHIIHRFKMAMTYNYNIRYPILGKLWEIMSRFVHRNDGTYSDGTYSE